MKNTELKIFLELYLYGVFWEFSQSLVLMVLMFVFFFFLWKRLENINIKAHGVVIPKHLYESINL